MGLSELLSLNSLKEGSPLRVGAKLKVTLGDTETVPTSGSPAPSQSSQAQKASPSPRANPSPRVNPSPKPSPTPAATGGIKALTWPVAGEVAYMDGLLYGVTITGKKGDPVRAVAGGTVIRADFFRGYSDVVFVQREDKTIYVYSGNDGILVRKGDVIQSGTKIGYLGIDPKTNKAILSFMVFKNGKALDPYTSPRD
jgi:lipoprotein NlpD